MFLYVYKKTFHISLVRITQKGNADIMWNLQQIIFMWRKRFLDFQICISIPLRFMVAASFWIPWVPWIVVEFLWYLECAWKGRFFIRLLKLYLNSNFLNKNLVHTDSEKPRKYQRKSFFSFNSRKISGK